jgi:hypothetical protein
MLLLSVGAVEHGMIKQIAAPSSARFSPLGPRGILLPDVIKHHKQIANEDYSH